jgi:hypothetical protein
VVETLDRRSRWATVSGVTDKHGRCITPRKGRRGTRCTRYVDLGSFGHSDLAVRSSFHFTGRVGGWKLRRGSYELRVVPRAANGKTGAPTILEFRVIK